MNKVKSIIISINIILLVGILFLGSSYNNEKDKSFHEDYIIKPVTIPDNIIFANEKVPLNNFDTYESLDREILINTYWQSQTLIFLKRAYRYFPIIEPILKEHNVPTDFKYLAVAESGLSNIVSPSKACGFWQFLKGTAQDYKLEVNSEVDERYNLEKSTHAAAQFLRESYEKYGTWTLAAASYNMGRRNISKQIARQKSDNYYDLILGEETGRYVYRLIALKLIMENPKKYGFFIKDTEKYQPIPYHTIEIDSSITSIPDFANSLGINYKIIKELNPWLRDNKLSNPNKKTYTIKIVSKDFRYIEKYNKFYPKEPDLE
jgi:hypothetical protein